MHTNVAHLVLVRKEKWDEAEAELRRIVATQKQLVGPRHIDYLTSSGELAEILVARGQLVEAEMILRQVLDVMSQLHGDNHLDTITHRNCLAWCLRQQKKWDQAEAILHQQLELLRGTLGTQHPDTLTCMISLASVLGDLNRLVEAEEMMEVWFLSVITLSTAEAHHASSSSSRWPHLKLTVANVIPQRAVEETSLLMGPSHPMVVAATRRLIDLQLGLGKHVRRSWFSAVCVVPSLSLNFATPLLSPRPRPPARPRFPLSPS